MQQVCMHASMYVRVSVGVVYAICGDVENITHAPIRGQEIAHRAELRATSAYIH